MGSRPGDGDLHEALVVVVGNEVCWGDDGHDDVENLRQVGNHVTVLQAEEVTSLKK